MSLSSAMARSRSAASIMKVAGMAVFVHFFYLRLVKWFYKNVWWADLADMILQP